MYVDVYMIYVCVYVCTHVCMRVYVYMYDVYVMYVWVYVCMILTFNGILSDIIKFVNTCISNKPH